MAFARSVLFSAAASLVLATPAAAAPSQAGVVLTRQANLSPGDAPPLAQVDGTVALWVYAAPRGRAHDIRLSSSSGRPALDAAAIRTVKRWHSLPWQADAPPGAQWIVVRMIYDPRAVAAATRTAAR